MSKQLKPTYNASLLDWLIEEVPEKGCGAVKTPQQQLQRLRTCLQRDLENLFNTHRVEFTWPTQWRELNCSLIAYGITDFTGENFANIHRRAKFCTELSQAIAQFEPRLQQVKIELHVDECSLTNCLQLHIEALLLSNASSSEPISITFEI